MQLYKPREKPFSRIRCELKVDNSEMNASIGLKIEKLQQYLVAENAIMDILVAETKKAKVLSLKFNYANKHSGFYSYCFNLPTLF